GHDRIEGRRGAAELEEVAFQEPTPHDHGLVVVGVLPAHEVGRGRHARHPEVPRAFRDLLGGRARVIHAPARGRGIAHHEREADVVGLPPGESGGGEHLARGPVGCWGRGQRADAGEEEPGTPHRRIIIRAMAARVDTTADHPALAWMTLIAVAFSLAATLASAWREAETPDEPVHLEWSRRLLVEGVTERRSNEYFESKSPITMLNVLARRLARRAVSGEDPSRRERVLRLASRAPTAGLLAALLFAVFVAARRWVGSTAAHLATIGCALDPNLIAHGGLATVDV